MESIDHVLSQLLCPLPYFPEVSPLNLESSVTETLAKVTTVTELKGISMAATTGDKTPCTAKERPTRLYRNDIP